MNFLLGNGMRQIIESIAAARKPQPALARRHTSIPPGPGERRPTRYDGWWPQYSPAELRGIEAMGHMLGHLR